MKPRILVADDDLGVIAAYRCALASEVTDAWRDNDEVDALRAELFAESAAASAGGETAWRVEFVRQGQDAFDAVCTAALESDPFSVVFLDVRMPPGIDGCETARRIRQIDQQVHIVFVTGYSDYTEEELAEAASPVELVSFLQKPVWPQQLRSKAETLAKAA